MSPSLQRVDQYVGRTTHWLYDHLRFVKDHKAFILADELINRGEFSLLEARSFNENTLARPSLSCRPDRFFSESLSR